MTPYTHATPPEIAARLREMAAEVELMTQRLDHFKPPNPSREHPAVNARAAVGGTKPPLMLAAGLVAEVEQSYERRHDERN